MALRRFCPAIKVHLWARRAVVVEALRAQGIADVVSNDLSCVLADADLVVLATPVGIMEELSLAILKTGGMTSDCIITDVGSVKESVMDGFADVFADSGIRCIGSHPMAGSEKTGIDHARSELFAGAPCVITAPSSEGNDSAVKKLKRFWESVGMKTCVMAASEHDRLVARISHLPHLMASAMVEVAFCDEAEAVSLAGTGFIDSTRIAAGAPDMWTEILMENREAVITELKRLQMKLGESLAFLESGDEEGLMHFLASAKEHRDSVGLKETSE